MTPDRTALSWNYEPQDYFEAAFTIRTKDAEVTVDSGKLEAVLLRAEHPVPQHTEDRIRGVVDGIFSVRRLQVHRTFDLRGPVVYQHASGIKHVFIRGTVGACSFATGKLDVIVRDAHGNIARDTRAERIGRDEAVLRELAPKAAESFLLGAVLRSYGEAVRDPRNELVYLYEVRDALVRHFGDEYSTRKSLGISGKNWSAFGRIANVEPLSEGRHRGCHAASLRAATEAELSKARELVRTWIYALAKTL